MRKNKYLFLILIIVISFAFSAPILAGDKWNIVRSPQNFKINGKTVDINALNINNNNYLKVAEFAEFLDIDIEYDKDTNTVSFDKNRPFTGVRTASKKDNIGANGQNENANVVSINIEELKKGDKIIIQSEVKLEKGDKIVFDIKSTPSAGDIFASFVDEADSAPHSTNYYGSGDYISGSGRVSRTIPKCNIEGNYYVRIANQGDEDIYNITGTVTIEKSQ